MPRLSKLIEKLEDWLEPKVGPWYERHKKKLPLYAGVGLVAWYFYGMFLNSIRLGTAATFHQAGEEVKSIWVFNPFRNWFIVLIPFGLGVTAAIILLVCLVTRKGFNWLAGNKVTHDPRGFDMVAGDNNNLLCIGAPGSGKSRGFIIPFLMGCAQRGESVFITDPKGDATRS